ncbi:UNVERIFIED_CONTAM: hypothetical protein Slati_3687200 [Sesamum latifolium]|uniref:Uncharacterized protein n=1 Tax=Sesamum latifolium TaxID=2727402 RepID=A0AAW2U157_9LAMI
MRIGFWNVRGFNRPLIHNGVAYLIKNYQLYLLDILETKLVASAIPRTIRRSFSGWCQTNNFDTIAGGCILVIWNSAIIDLHPEDISPQVIHCRLDRVLLNNEWLEAGLDSGAHFSPPGFLSDYSSGIVSLFDPPAPKPKPFRFFNMWANHPNFLATVENGWNVNVEGTPQFSFCRKLKALKGPLKTFNKLHYNHISIRAKEADLVLQDAQILLESDPENAAIRSS